MLALVLRTLRYRTGGFIATLVSVFVGTAVMLACGGLMETGIRTVIPPQRLAAAPIVVAGNQSYDLPAVGHGEDADHETATLSERVRLDEGLAATISGVPGVAHVVPDVSFHADVLADTGGSSVPGTQAGHSWVSAELAPYRLTDGVAPIREGEVVLDSATAGRIGAHAGSKTDIAVRGGVHSYLVTGIADAGRRMAGDAVFFSPAEAGGLRSAAGQVDAFGVQLAPGADVTAVSAQIATAVHDRHAVTLTGDARGSAEFARAAGDGELLIILAAVFGGLAAQVAMFVVASTLTLSVQQRRREVAMLRAIGATPRQLSRMITGESMIIGALGTALAIVPGMLLGDWLFGRLTGFGVIQPVLKFEQGFYPVVAAAVVGLSSAWGAAFVAARYAGRTRPVEAMRETAIPTRWLTPTRLWLGVSSLIGAVALAYLTITVVDGPLAASTAGPAVTLVATAVALFAPGLTRLLVGVVRRPIRALGGLPGYLASLNARARWMPMAGAVTPIMLATGLAIFMLYFQTTEVAVAEKQYSDSLLADAVVTSATGDLPPDLVAKVQQAPGVGGATAFVTSKGYNEKPSDSTQDEDGVDLTGVTADGIAQAWGSIVATGKLDDLHGTTIALPADLAQRLGVGVGAKIVMRLGDGSLATLDVVATLRTTAASASALMPAETLAPHTAAGAPDRILVMAKPGTGEAELLAGLRSQVGGADGVQVAGREALTKAFVAEVQANAWVNYLIVGLLLVYAAISTVNTLVMATADRRREFGLQRLIGSTRGQVLRMMAVEAGIVAAIGVFLGTLVAASMLVPFSAAVSDSPVPSGPLWIYLVILGLAVVLTVVATCATAWFTLRTRPSPSTLAPE
ncbi:FtsX-like permease family protein [Amycolatopsis vancoresmycina]|uniref:FtsX-like permease family protein n=1 Tax=Amycolatopsis vancoresmycina TaxID=208444 RepID=UPI0005243AF1|nr:FtsX-like permease family protein [Amycolatopsis vancoresmycina]